MQQGGLHLCCVFVGIEVGHERKKLRIVILFVFLWKLAESSEKYDNDHCTRHMIDGLIISGLEGFDMTRKRCAQGLKNSLTFGECQSKAGVLGGGQPRFSN